MVPSLSDSCLSSNCFSSEPLRKCCNCWFIKRSKHFGSDLSSGCGCNDRCYIHLFSLPLRPLVLLRPKISVTKSSIIHELLSQLGRQAGQEVRINSEWVIYCRLSFLGLFILLLFLTLFLLLSWLLLLLLSRRLPIN